MSFITDYIATRHPNSPASRPPHHVTITRAQFEHAVASIEAMRDLSARADARCNLLAALNQGCVEVVS
jgi:hypothetical protein